MLGAPIYAPAVALDLAVAEAQSAVEACYPQFSPLFFLFFASPVQELSQLSSCIPFSVCLGGVLSIGLSAPSKYCVVRTHALLFSPLPWLFRQFTFEIYNVATRVLEVHEQYQMRTHDYAHS